MSTSPAERSYHHGDLREALLRASRELIAERGPEAFTLREVARRAGVSHTAPYRHFRDRAAILDAIAAEGFAAHRDAGRRAAAEHEDPRERLRAAGRAYVEFALEERAAFQVMFRRSSDNPEVAALGAESFAELLARVAEGQAAGIIGPGDPHQIAGVLWSGVHGVAELAGAGSLALVSGGDTGAMIDFVLATLLRGLAPED